MWNTLETDRVPHERIIKPIAFKPIVTPGSRYPSTPPTAQNRPSPPSPPSTLRPVPIPGASSTLPMSPRHDNAAVRLANHSQDDGYISQDSNHASLLMHATNMNTSHNSSHHGGLPVTNGLSFTNGYKTCGSDTRSESYTSSNLSRVSSNPGVDVSMTTPSPSDSGVVDAEALLRSKDAEISQLRDTMEKNELAILKVYEERRQNWQVEVREYADEWERRLRAQTQKASKTEQSLLMQIFNLQQDRKALRTEADQYRTERDQAEKRLADVTAELGSTRGKLEEAQWELHNKSGEIGMLKAQLKDAKDDTTSRTADLVGLRTQVRELSQEREQSEAETGRLRGELRQSKEDLHEAQARLEEVLGELEAAKRRAEELASQNDASNNNNDVAKEAASGLETELCRLRTEYGDAKTTFQREREQWLDEKNKVIRYQKHLQLNYIQMVRKNKMMEAEIEQLTLELENRDIKLMADGLPVTEEESVC